MVEGPAVAGGGCGAGGGCPNADESADVRSPGVTIRRCCAGSPDVM